MKSSFMWSVSVVYKSGKCTEMFFTNLSVFINDLIVFLFACETREYV